MERHDQRVPLSVPVACAAAERRSGRHPGCRCCRQEV